MNLLHASEELVRIGLLLMNNKPLKYVFGREQLWSLIVMNSPMTCMSPAAYLPLEAVSGLETLYGRVRMAGVGEPLLCHIAIALTFSRGYVH